MVSPGAGGGFEASVGFVAGQVVLRLRGVLDEPAVAGLGTLVDSMITSGFRSVIVDLALLESVSTAGLAVITGAAMRIADRRGQFVLRSPSVAVRQLLDHAGMTALVQNPPLPRAGDRLGPEQIPDTGDPRVRPLVHDLGRASTVPATDDVVDGSLRLVVALARASVGGADGVSISQRRHGRLSTVAASDETISAMDARQYATGEGPCVDASVDGRWFHVRSLDTEPRWPAFIPQAKALGINAILSSPLTASDTPVGSINIYSRTVSAFGPEDQRLASVLAIEASSLLTEAGLDLTDDERSAQFQDALLTRAVIAQAQGVLMEREGVSEDEAYVLLRIHSQHSGQPLHRRAQDVVTSTQRHPRQRGTGDTSRTDHPS
jgi:anti-anti-sigma factor